MKKILGILTVILLAAKPGLSSEPQQVTPSPQPETNKITFECEIGADFPAILTKSENKASVVFLSWIPEYFPQTELARQQCEKAAQKLQNKQETEGGIQGLELITEEINDIPVVCLIQKDQDCQEENILFSLENSKKLEPDEVLAKMLNRNLLPDNMKNMAVRGVFRLHSIPLPWLPF